ncbi:MAG: lysyl endopeptidase [Saccharothrix sp.]|nr:lysyl endopeptidase [Saccharothrix sp.]
MDPTPTTAGRSALYVGGRSYPGNPDAERDIEEIRRSDFDTIFIWSIHVEVENPEKGRRDGDLVYNDVPIISNGEYIGDNRWPALLERLKRAGKGAAAKRVEVSVGSGEVHDWTHIRDLMLKYGTAPVADNPLRVNFETLLRVTRADALNSDNEDCYDGGSAKAFAEMVRQIGYDHFTFTPYTREDYWADLKRELGDYVDRAYIQCYSGGKRNAYAKKLKEWSRKLGGMNVYPGLWCKHQATKNDQTCSKGDEPGDMKRTLRSWVDQGAPIEGGFVWLHDDIKRCEQADPGWTVAQYAKAVNEGTKPKATMAHA